MLIDTNAYLGPYAFRHLRHATAPELLALMDQHRIDQAWVSSSLAITYRNPQPANEELAAATRVHRDRLVPLAVINPAYAGWADDLKRCHEELGMRGLRLYPKWHGYELKDRRCLELVHEATRRGLVISIPVRAEDARQRSWLVDVPDVPVAELVALVQACPRARFVFVNGAGFAGSELGRKGSRLAGNYAMELSRLSALLANEIGQLVGNVGAERVVFGTGMPFTYPDPALLKLEVLDLSPAAAELIRWKNAARLLGEKGA
jgi:predicted TIM-barrel fold metal-dependent hydrolase